MRPVRTALPLSFGSIIHGGIEQWLLAAKEIKEGSMQVAEPDTAMLDLMLAGAQATFTGLDDEAEIDEYEWEKAQAMLVGYHFRWFDWVMSDDVEIVAVEVEFAVPLRNPATGRPSRLFKLGGKIDAIIRELGRKLIMEHKSSSEDVSAGSQYWQKLRIDGQVSTYYEGATGLGHDVEGCCYDVLSKPQIRPRLATPEENRKYTKGKGCKTCGGSAGGKRGVVRGTGQDLSGQEGVDLAVGGGSAVRGCADCGGTGWREPPRLHSNQRTEDERPEEYGARCREAIAANPEAFYAHGDVDRLDDEMEEYGTDTWITAQSLRLCQRDGGWARNPDACMLYGRFCAYWDVCTGQADIRDPGRFRHSTVLHPELSLAIQTPKEEAEDVADEEAGEDDRTV